MCIAFPSAFMPSNHGCIVGVTRSAHFHAVVDAFVHSVQWPSPGVLILNQEGIVCLHRLRQLERYNGFGWGKYSRVPVRGRMP